MSVRSAVNPRVQAVLGPDAAPALAGEAESTQHDHKEVSWDAQPLHHYHRVHRLGSGCARTCASASPRNELNDAAGRESEGDAHERYGRNELRDDGLGLTRKRQAHDPARDARLPRLGAPDDDRSDDAAPPAGRPAALDPRPGRRRTPDARVRRADAATHGRADDDESRHDDRFHEEGRVPPWHQDRRDEGRRHGRQDDRSRQPLAAGGDSRLTRMRLLLSLLGAGATLTSLAVDPALTLARTQPG